MINKKTKFLSTTAVIAALYVAITLTLGAFSFGVIQIRLGEMFNHLVVINKKYIVAIVIGCGIANLFSPLGIIDVFIGTTGTFIFLSISYLVTRKIKNLKVRLLINTIVISVSMFTVALELNYFYGSPFWLTYLSVAVGEAISMSIGAVIIYQIQKRFDLKKQI
ncbi:QueT transporter family protein [Listeria monocytogenes]|nr:QueT transporter family protein [Listeria monocytogenes]MCQ88019.1 QueT transporter family protein [Listeria monocytogenes]